MMDNNEEQFVQELSSGDDYIIALSVDDGITDQRREEIMDCIEQIDADRDGNLYAMVLSDGVDLEDADKISKNVVQRIADRVIAKLMMEAGNDVGETRKQTPLGGKTHS